MESLPCYAVGDSAGDDGGKLCEVFVFILNDDFQLQS